MAPDSSAPEPEKIITAADIARDWGTSRAYVSKCLKKGCPNVSLEAAREWRVANARYGIGYRSKSAKSEPEPVAAAPVPVEAPTRDLSTVDASLLAAIDVEREAYRLVQEAQRDRNDAQISIRIQAYNRAQSNRLDAERLVVEYREKTGELISLDAARALIHRAWSPHINRLRALPKRCALSVNPSDDIRAEKVLVDEIEAVIAETRQEFEL